MTVTEFVTICSVLNIATKTVKSAQNCFLCVFKYFLHLLVRKCRNSIYSCYTKQISTQTAQLN